jgi:hypothetical protein
VRRGPTSHLPLHNDVTVILGRIFIQKLAPVLCIQVLENHVFFDPKIERSLQLVMFFISDEQLRASSSCASLKKEFIDADDQEL